MKRLVVNAFRPGEHKVISSHAAKMAGEAHRFGRPKVIVDELLNCAVGWESTADFTGVDW